ncbi:MULTISPECIES: hypothetical protein [Paenibacillus]|uniref:Uncharacterized protein n=1 Tax=Paenibacillus odorifer TaxID=189426 RepID=A0A1R0YQ02_9BACL|nr:hypothetical protein [Paenibacillus odorifer]AWV35154.1 hypothetical protein CD191_22355 [Paenibacillus odorifer]OME07553.1 hypothetical protein BSK60_30890 [Paenibacillus odorifer]OME55119.1 hypothetical protein BSK61_13710 [Paenibacillus odorifer]
MSLIPKQWVVDDISEAALFDINSGDPVAYFERLNKMTFTIDAKQQRVYGGTSKYAFHLTEQDAESSVQLENAVLDLNQLVAATGATITTGSTVIPKVEKLLVATGGTFTFSKGASLVAGTDRLVIATKGLTNSGMQLTRVASAPTALQYSITSSGVVTLGDATLAGKDIRAFYDYTATGGTAASVKTDTKNKPYKFVAYGKAFDDETNESFECTIIIYKSQMLGSFSIDQQRKSATANSLELAVLDANRSDKKVIDILTN